MAELADLRTQLEKVQKDMIKMQDEASKSVKLEEELEETKKMLEAYKVSSKTVYINKDRKLPKFAGRPVRDTDLTVEEWIDDALYHLKTIEGNGNQVEFVYDHLVGQAKDEVRIRPEGERNTAMKMLDILREIFQDAETVAQLQQRFYQRNQKRDESLQSYSLVLMKLVDRMIKKDKAILGDRDLILTERFVDGVLDSQLRREMRRFLVEHKGTAFSNFRQLVLKWTEDDTEARTTTFLKAQGARIDEEVRTEANEQRAGSKISESQKKESGAESEMMKLLQSQQSMLKKQQEQIDVLTKLVTEKSKEQSKGPVRKPIVCFKCEGQGHMARDCPSKGNRSSGPDDKQRRTGAKTSDGKKENLNM